MSMFLDQLITGSIATLVLVFHADVHVVYWVYLGHIVNVLFLLF